MQHKQSMDPVTRVTEPIVVGSSVIGLKFRGGVVLASDTLLSYGGTLKHKNVNRIEKITNNLAIASTGQYADFQALTKKLKKLAEESRLYDDGIKYTVQEFANYLAHLAYEARNDFNPYYNTTILAGYENGEPFLGSVDHLGNYFHKDYALAGFAGYFCKPLLNAEWSKDGTEEEAKATIYKCFQVLFSRDCHSVDNIRFAVVSDKGVRIEEPTHVDLKFSSEMKLRANERLWQ